MTPRKNAVIKIGGTFLENKARLCMFFSELAEMQKRYTVVVVHGGGNTISAYSKSYGIKSRFTAGGLRLTSDAEMLYADRILSGEINTYLVRMALPCGIRAVGLSAVDGNLIHAQAIHEHTGRVTSCNTHVLETLTQDQYVPMVCSVASTKDGMALNVNADEISCAIAHAWHADYLVSLSDVNGIIIDDEIIPCMNTQDIQRYTEGGHICGGMVPKTENAIKALESGVHTIIIGSFSQQGDLHALFEGRRGTRIVKK